MLNINETNYQHFVTNTSFFQLSSAFLIGCSCYLLYKNYQLAQENTEMHLKFEKMQKIQENKDNKMIEQYNGMTEYIESLEKKFQKSQYMWDEAQRKIQEQNTIIENDKITYYVQKQTIIKMQETLESKELVTVA